MSTQKTASSDPIQVVKAFYDNAPQYEWDRLTRHPVEFEITKRILSRYIKPGQRVLDVGGGPGRYSCWLAEVGCEVTLVDLSDGNVGFAKAKAEEAGLCFDALQGDARFIDTLVEGPFDHILLMGPLYHLSEESDRVRVVQACMSLLAPGGMLFAAFISANADVWYYLSNAPEDILNPEVDFSYFINHQPFIGDAFTHAYFIRPCDVVDFMQAQGLTTRHYLGAEGILSVSERNLMLLSPEVLKAWVDLAEKVCERPDLIGMSEHLLYVGQKGEGIA